MPATFAAPGERRRSAGQFTIRRGDFAIGEGAWAAFDIVANDVTVRFRNYRPARATHRPQSQEILT